MKTRNLLKKCATLILTLTIALASSASVYGQQNYSQRASQPTNAQRASDQLLKDYEIALLEVERLRAQLSGKDEIIKLKDEEIAARKAIDEINRQRIQALLDAVKERTTANTLDDKRIALFEDSLNQFKAELSKVRAERDKARKQRSIFAIGGVIVGGFLALLGQR
jgi:hypothetical protein